MLAAYAQTWLLLIYHIPNKILDMETRVFLFICSEIAYQFRLNNLICHNSLFSVYTMRDEIQAEAWMMFNIWCKDCLIFSCLRFLPVRLRNQREHEALWEYLFHDVSERRFLCCVCLLRAWDIFIYSLTQHRECSLTRASLSPVCNTSYNYHVVMVTLFDFNTLTTKPFKRLALLVSLLDFAVDREPEQSATLPWVPKG